MLITMDQRLEGMRISAESDRIQKYRNIAANISRSYYNLIDSFTKILDKRQQLPAYGII
jgi:hypothetical protein